MSNTKTAPVEMSYTENQLLKTAVALTTAVLTGDMRMVSAAMQRYTELAAKIGDERGQAFFDRMTAHARSLAPAGDDEDENAVTTDAPPAPAPSAPGAETITDERPVFLNEKEAKLISLALSGISGFVLGDLDDATMIVSMYAETATEMGMNEQEALEMKFRESFPALYAPKGA